MKELTILLNEEREEAFKLIEKNNKAWKKINEILYDKYLKENKNKKILREEKNRFITREDKLKYENEVLKYQLEFAHSEMDFMQRKIVSQMKSGSTNTSKAKSPLSIN